MNEKLLEKVVEKYLLGGVTECQPTKEDYSFIGKYVIVRGYDAGVRCGKLLDDTVGHIVLEDARNLRYWRCKKGIGLSGLSTNGMAKRKEVKVLNTIKEVIITDQRVSIFFECATEVEKELRSREVAEQE